MQRESGTIRVLLRSITKALKTHTIDELSKKIEASINVNEDEDSVYVAFVLNRVAGLYGISKHAVLCSKLRGNVVEARKNCIILLHAELGLAQSHIAKILQRNRTVIHFAIKEFYGLCPEKNKRHKLFVENYNLVKEELKVKIEQNKK